MTESERLDHRAATWKEPSRESGRGGSRKAQ